MDLRTERERDLKSLIVKNIDECDYSENYNLLIKEICSKKGEESKGFYLYSSEKMNEVLDSLSDREKDVIINRYGLMDGKYRTLKEVGTILGVTQARIRVLEQSALRMLKNKNKTLCHIINIDEKIRSYDVSIEEKKMLFNAQNTISFFSNDDKKIKTARETLKKYMLSEVEKITPDKIGIADLDLSRKTYMSLARTGIKTLEDILKYDNLIRIRNLGKSSLEEIKNKISEFNFGDEAKNKISESNSDDETKDDKKTPDKIGIDELGLSSRAHNRLYYAGIKTLEDILKYDKLIRIRNLGKKTLTEIKDKVNELGFDVDTGYNKESNQAVVPIKKEPAVNDESIEVLRTETEELKTTIEEKAERSKLLDEYIKIAKQHAKLKEIESKIDEEIRRKEEILKGFGFKYEK